jgi:hypothetical protein
MPVRRMTDEEADRIFGNGLIIFGGWRKAPSKTPHESPSVLDEKRDPCLDGSRMATLKIDLSPQSKLT